MNPFSGHSCLRNDLAPATSSEVGAHDTDCLDLIYWVASTLCRRPSLRSGGGGGYFELRAGWDGVRIVTFAAMFLVSLPRFQALKMESIKSTSPSWGLKVLLFDLTVSRPDVSKTSFHLGESVVVDGLWLCPSRAWRRTRATFGAFGFVARDSATLLAAPTPPSTGSPQGQVAVVFRRSEHCRRYPPHRAAGPEAGMDTGLRRRRRRAVRRLLCRSHRTARRPADLLQSASRSDHLELTQPLRALVAPVTP